MGEFAVNWAKGDTDALSEWLAEDLSWTLVGGQTHHGPQAAQAVSPPFWPERVELISLITHGRLASCVGYLEEAGRRLGFSHAFRFTSTAKTAELWSYCIETPRT